jgi:ribonucleoside-diphosphate reductase alpha chain
MAEPAIAMIKQFSSSGYLRKRLPTELVVLNGGNSGRAEAVASMALETVGASAAAATVVGAVAGSAASAVMGRVEEARMKGYEGDACGDCGNFTLVRNGTCMKCDTCGATSGCS